MSETSIERARTSGYGTGRFHGYIRIIVFF